jgi:GTP-binding protein
MPLLQQATFLTTVAHLRDMPADSLREVAFAGRSNAGKSSAINALAAHTRLAYVSKTPGRTQHLNYFTIVAGKYLVDLPGYGFAKAPEAIRAQWETLLGPYLQLRPQLVGLVLIMDSRHPLTDLDRRMIDWFAPTGRPLLVLLSKADKLSRQQALETQRKVRVELAGLGERCSVQLFSSLKRTGIDEAERVLAAWLDEPLPESLPVKAPVRTPSTGRPAANRRQPPGAVAARKSAQARGRPGK